MSRDPNSEPSVKVEDAAGRPIRLPCRSCPWRRSTPQGGFPGGCIDARRLMLQASGEFGYPAMQCHRTPDGEKAKVCVGFALVVGFDSVELRMAALVGRYDPDRLDTDEELHSIYSLIQTHGTFDPVPVADATTPEE